MIGSFSLFYLKLVTSIGSCTDVMKVTIHG